ncbi:unnamed protein product [Spirodela intermedia]|uniref:Uncharacterized protein n=1 Tax=Spirodela intermedia TaxID=51605 RepID=A0A7I8JGB3_SPIIN|nr:unnamed protein product [Spirodela intermedia]CAA6668991.1 unnamed protein product [Spirodela intermedia]
MMMMKKKKKKKKKKAEAEAEAASWSQNSMNTTAIRENKGKNRYSGESAKGF